jgi:hypothetical protein
MKQIECLWHIQKSIVPLAHTALVEWAKGAKYTSWIDTQEVVKSNDLKAAMKSLRFATTFDTHGDVSGFEFTERRFGNELEVFMTLAPYSKEGDRIRFRGADGCLWGYMVKSKNGKKYLAEQYGAVIWE